MNTKRSAGEVSELLGSLQLGIGVRWEKWAAAAHVASSESEKNADA